MLCLKTETDCQTTQVLLYSNVLLLTVVVLCFTEEYVAHASNVQSVCLGQHSGRLLATGGEDCQINLWSLDKPNCQMVSCLDSFFIDFSITIRAVRVF